LARHNRETNMSDAISSYLLVVAQIAITFGGFGALYFGLQQQRPETAEFNFIITRNHFYSSSVIVGGALLPSLLMLLMPAMLAWRIASVTTAAPVLWLVMAYPGLRRAARREAMPTHTKIILALWVLAAVILLLNLFHMHLGLYAFALTMMLFLSFHAFVYALGAARRPAAAPDALPPPVQGAQAQGDRRTTGEPH
jgi:hypothetical protein